MKNKIHYLLLALTFVIVYNMHAIPMSCIGGGVKGGKLGCTPPSKKFKRIYNYTQINKQKNIPKKATDISITFDDFTSHLEIGKERLTVFTLNNITMDIGSINSGVNETWILPDLSTNSNFTSATQTHIPASETDIYTSFGYGTHGIYSDEIIERDDLYDLQTDKLTFVGFEEVIEGGDYNNDEDWEEYQYDQLRAVIPLELGLNYSSKAKFEEVGNPTNYIEYTDAYDVIGQGTLETYDSASAPALKVIYKEETRTFENNVEVSYSERYELIFYSKKGHYIYASIQDPYNNEGIVSLSNITYQKVLGKTASVREDKLEKITTFPNPVEAGQQLTFVSEIPLLESTLDIFNVNGQKIHSLSLTNKNTKQYQISIPKNIASGLYFYTVIDVKNTNTIQGKIQIK